MPFRPGGTDYGPTGPAAGGEGFDPQWNGTGEHEIVPKKRVAVCEHSFSRVLMNWILTCSTCTFRLAHKAKEKRQRVLISSVYERGFEHISNRIEELYGIIGQLRCERHNSDSSLMTSTRIRAPSYSSLQSDSSRAFSNAPAPTEGIESALSTHAICAARAPETAKQQNEALEGSLSFLKAAPSGLSLRDLRTPSMDKIMACLRITQENSPSEIYWPFEFGSLGDFTQCVIRACTPDPISDMELIIVHYVLYSLFTQCSIGADDEKLKQGYGAQAATCRESLETILSSLSFHIDTNIDSIYALYGVLTAVSNIQSLHCLHRGKVYTAWTFISRASLMCLALEFHSSHAMVTEQENAVQRKICLFWAVPGYHHPRLTLDRKTTSLAYNQLPDWIDVASLHGRLYDSLYSPTALTQPDSFRGSRTRALASDLERLIAARTAFYSRPDLWSNHVLDLNLSQYSTLASIYRGMSTDSPSRIIPCTQCIAAARVALEESKASIAVLSEAAIWPTGLHEWINEIFLLAPFIPITILVYNAVDTADASDLGRLRGVVDGLQALAQSPRYASCNRQLRIFKPLYDVAACYVETKTFRGSTDTIGSLFTNPDTDVYFNDDTWFINEFSPVSSFSRFMVWTRTQPVTGNPRILSRSTYPFAAFAA
ncbi:hypothetical protein BDW72DRAFT_207613 [Aspergillus terricola var. indicus]